MPEEKIILRVNGKNIKYLVQILKPDTPKNEVLNYISIIFDTLKVQPVRDYIIFIRDYIIFIYEPWLKNLALEIANFDNTVPFTFQFQACKHPGIVAVPAFDENNEPITYIIDDLTLLQSHRHKKLDQLMEQLRLWKLQSDDTFFGATMHEFGGPAFDVRITKQVAIDILNNRIDELVKEIKLDRYNIR